MSSRWSVGSAIITRRASSRKRQMPPDQVGGAVADERRGGSGVAADLKRKHRGIGYPEVGYAAHPEVVVDHVGVVRAIGAEPTA